MTVEAASPALTEKVRTAVTDGSGRYRIEPLPPGSYTVTFSLIGFAPVKREDVIVSGSVVITVDVALTVGGLAETITVTPRRRDEASLDVPPLEPSLRTPSVQVHLWHSISSSSALRREAVRERILSASSAQS